MHMLSPDPPLCAGRSAVLGKTVPVSSRSYLKNKEIKDSVLTKVFLFQYRWVSIHQKAIRTSKRTFYLNLIFKDTVLLLGVTPKIILLRISLMSWVLLTTLRPLGSRMWLLPCAQCFTEWIMIPPLGFITKAKHFLVLLLLLCLGVLYNYHEAGCTENAGDYEDPLKNAISITNLKSYTCSYVSCPHLPTSTPKEKFELNIFFKLLWERNLRNYEAEASSKIWCLE